MKKIKILIVDDDETTLNIMKKTLEVYYHVTTAKNAILALNIYKELNPDIIISDIAMPQLNGIEMVKRIRECDKNCKIILLSAYNNLEYLLKATELMLIKYLIKPIDSDKLFEAISLAIKEKEDYNFVSKKILKLNKNCYWDYENTTFFKKKEEVLLTPKEREILILLFTNPCTIKTYDEIIYEVWPNSDTNDKQNLKILMSGLRKKIPEDIIVNIYGIGYKILTTS